MMEGVLWHKRLSTFVRATLRAAGRRELTPGCVGMQGRLREHNGIQHGRPSVLIEQAYSCNALLH